MKRVSILFVLGFLFLIEAGAQILPPDFRCMKGDTLLWDLPVNTCGPFVGYEVWGSQSASGPFNLVATITDPSQTSYFFVNPSGTQWFFYLLSDFDCPGQTAIPSDTLDNRPPEVSPIQDVSVVNGQVVVTWYPSPSPEVTAYIIYRQTDIGVVAIDTVFSGNSYLDTSAKPDMASESYFVNALDPCGNTSIFDSKHSTIYQEATVNPCRQSASLQWNLYQNWQNGIGEQRIWVGTNGAPPVLVATLPGSASSYEYVGLNDGGDYCFVVEAVETGTGAASLSNEVCITADIVQAMRGLYIEQVTMTPSNEVLVTWGWDTSAEINEIQILSAAQNGGYQSIATIAPIFPLTALNTHTDPAALAVSAPVFYKIQTQDDCDSTALSTFGATIHLAAGSIPGNINQLSWTGFELENAVATGYTLYSIVGGVESQLDEVAATTLSYDDGFDPTNLAEAQACYYVVATATLTKPDGSTVETNSRSNTACVEQNVRILAPNAFAPDGVNQEFRPLIVLGDLKTYEMRIFDRYGQEVFFSTTPEDGWNGKKGDRKLPQGVYAYVIRVEQANGKESEKRGMVLLLR